MSKEYKVTIEGKEFDVSSAFPMYVSDWIALKKSGAPLSRIQSMGEDVDENLEVTFIVATYILAKAGHEVPPLPISALPQFISLLSTSEGEEEVDRPT